MAWKCYASSVMKTCKTPAQQKKQVTDLWEVYTRFCKILTNLILPY